MVIPMILSGGAGTRLWPLSRNTKPKQFLKFGSDYSLIQETILRCQGAAFDPRPIVVSADSHRFMVAEDLKSIGVDADILLEPMRRDSGPAIVAGCLCALERSPDALVLSLAADHLIPDKVAFQIAVRGAIADAQDGYIVTFGIKPDFPATGYGYIRPGAALRPNASFAVAKFVEKPDQETAKTYIADGYFWNSGNFLFRADVLLAEIARYAPEVLAAMKPTLAHAKRDMDFIRLDEKNFATSPQISIDYALMEKTAKSAVYPVSYQWNDIGSWDAVLDVLPRDGSGNAIVGKGVVVQGRNNLVHADQRLTTIIGADDLVVVSTRDAVLVSKRGGTDDMKKLVAELKVLHFSEADTALQIFRPWGNYEILDAGTGFEVRRLTVNSGEELSLQMHAHRSEHWTVVSGAAEVVIGSRIETVLANQSAFVPLGMVHRLSNRGAEPLVLIEVRCGAELNEDDIIRLEDKYNRDLSIRH